MGGEFHVFYRYGEAIRRNVFITFKIHINVVVVKSAGRFGAYPSKEQKAILDRQMSIAKEFHNFRLGESKEYRKETEEALTKYRMNFWLTQIKKDNPEFEELH